MSTPGCRLPLLRNPCATFSDALTIMEGSERPRAFLWALREAEPPTGESAACKKLRPRLQRLLAAVEPTVEPTKSTRHNKKSRARPQRGSSPAPAQPAAPTPLAEPSPKPQPKTGVATKLDDDLRGL